MNIQKHCIVCGFHKLYPIYIDHQQPLCALNLPKSHKEATNAKRLPLNFCSCARCGHIFNFSFAYDQVPYSDGSNLMYNSGDIWNQYLDQLITKINKKLPLKQSTVIEIGCGNGIFLQKIKAQFSNAKCIGFDPSIDATELNSEIQGIKDYFVPERDIELYKPDILICRHVIEHLEDPFNFMADIAFWCSYYNHYPLFVVEMPKINKAIEQKRTSDLIYEHVSNFSDRSFKFLTERSGFNIEEISSEYNDEVILAFIKAIPDDGLSDIKNKSKNYFQGIQKEKENVEEFLNTLDKNKTAFWGATGKGAAFLNAFNVSNDRFPLIVDSDERKCGFYVPGTGQLIQNASILLKNPVDNIIVTTSWRVQDIYLQIKKMKIAYQNVYYIKNNNIVVYSE